MNLALHTLLLQIIVWVFNWQYVFRLCSAGEPGYLDFDNLPETNFSCQGKVIGGYYADVEAGCQMFHVCTVGQKDEIMDIKFLCLNGTVFDQETRVCERVDEVDCSKSERFYNLNLELYGNNAVTLSLHETSLGEEDLNEALENLQQRTSSIRPNVATTSTTATPLTTTTTTKATTLSSTTTTPRPSVLSLGESYRRQPSGFKHERYQSQQPNFATTSSRNKYDDKNAYHHQQYIYHNNNNNNNNKNNQATSYQLLSNSQGQNGGSGSASSAMTGNHQIRYNPTSGGPQIIRSEGYTVTPLQFHVTSSTVKTLLSNNNGNSNNPSLINPLFHNQGISSSTTERYHLHSSSPREISTEYEESEHEEDGDDDDEEGDEDGDDADDDDTGGHIEDEEKAALEQESLRKPLQVIQSSNQGKVSKLAISPVPQQHKKEESSKTVVSQQMARIEKVPSPTTPRASYAPSTRVVVTAAKKESFQNDDPQLVHLQQQQQLRIAAEDIQRIVQNPSPLLPSQSRVIVTAKASVSDESGRPLNASQLIHLPLPTIPTSYDDYKEGDESFDPFYRDVPKINRNPYHPPQPPHRLRIVRQYAQIILENRRPALPAAAAAAATGKKRRRRKRRKRRRRRRRSLQEFSVRDQMQRTPTTTLRDFDPYSSASSAQASTVQESQQPGKQKYDDNSIASLRDIEEKLRKLKAILLGLPLSEGDDTAQSESPIETTTATTATTMNPNAQTESTTGWTGEAPKHYSTLRDIFLADIDKTSPNSDDVDDVHIPAHGKVDKNNKIDRKNSNLEKADRRRDFPSNRRTKERSKTRARTTANGVGREREEESNAADIIDSGSINLPSNSESRNLDDEITTTSDETQSEYYQGSRKVDEEVYTNDENSAFHEDDKRVKDISARSQVPEIEKDQRNPHSSKAIEVESLSKMAPRHYKSNFKQGPANSGEIATHNVAVQSGENTSSQEYEEYRSIYDDDYDEDYISDQQENSRSHEEDPRINGNRRGKSSAEQEDYAYSSEASNEAEEYPSTIPPTIEFDPEQTSNTPDLQPTTMSTTIPYQTTLHNLPQESKGVLDFINQLSQDLKNRITTTPIATTAAPIETTTMGYTILPDYVDDNYEPQVYQEQTTLKAKQEEKKKDNRKLVESKTEASKTDEPQTTPSTSTTPIPTRTTPVLFKPPIMRKNYNNLQLTTSPNPVFIKPRFSLLNPKPSKPRKSYNELAAKPVIRKSSLNRINSTTAATNTSERNDHTEPSTTSAAVFTSSSPVMRNVTEDSGKILANDESLAVASRSNAIMQEEHVQVTEPSAQLSSLMTTIATETGSMHVQTTTGNYKVETTPSTSENSTRSTRRGDRPKLMSIQHIDRKATGNKNLPGFNCLEKQLYEFYSDSRDCRLFHYCSPGFTSRQVLDFRFVCEEGTIFDEIDRSCQLNGRNTNCTKRA